MRIERQSSVRSWLRRTRVTCTPRRNLKKEGRDIERIIVGVPKVGKLKSGFDALAATVAGVEFAKEWANRPANHATPSMLADAARSLAKFPKIKCEVLGPKEVEKLKMGAFMAVAQGSEQPLQFIVLRYDGAAVTSSRGVGWKRHHL